MEVIKYSKLKLMNYLQMFKHNIYLYFYDLESDKFEEVIFRFRTFISNISNFELFNRNYKSLLISGEIIKNQLSLFINELDNLDFGEVEIIELREDFNLQSNNLSEKEFLSFIKDNITKSLYLNKDEKIIQFYSFS